MRLQVSLIFGLLPGTEPVSGKGRRLEHMASTSSSDTPQDSLTLE